MIPEQKVHKSVYYRMQRRDLPPYTPRAKLSEDCKSWEDARQDPNHQIWATWEDWRPRTPTRDEAPGLYM
jgi:poly(3-hydroxyalkanoate) synthetase